MNKRNRGISIIAGHQKIEVKKINLEDYRQSCIIQFSPSFWSGTQFHQIILKIMIKKKKILVYFLSPILFPIKEHEEK